MIARNTLIAACAIVSGFGAAGMALAGQPIGGLVVKGGCNYVPGLPCPRSGQKFDSVSVQLNLSRSETWTFEPVRGTLTPSTAISEGLPIPGVGVIVKRNPPRGAAMIIPVDDGGNAQLARLGDGTYDVSIRVPNTALSTRSRGGGDHGIELTFTIVKRGGTLTNLVQPPINNKGNGSPKAQGF